MKLSNLDMTYRIRENGKKRNLFQKVEEIKRQLKQTLPELSPNRYIPILARCRNYYEGNLYYGRKTTDPEEKRKRKKLQLTDIERIVYDFLLRNNYNPSTTYRWFLACRVPDDIKEKLEKNQISYRVAMATSYNRKRVRESNMGILMLEEMRTIVRGL